MADLFKLKEVNNSCHDYIDVRGRIASGAAIESAIDSEITAPNIHDD